MFRISDNTGMDQPFHISNFNEGIFFPAYACVQSGVFKSVLAILLNPANPRRVSVSFSRERTPDESGEEL